MLAAALRNDRSSNRSIEKRPSMISWKEQCLSLHWNTLQHWRECLSLLECYKIVFRLNGLDFNGYFEYCKIKNTRANHPYKKRTKSAKVNSLKYSFFVKIIKDWNNLPNHLFTDEIRLSNLLSMQNGDIFQPQTNHMSVDRVSHMGGLEFFPQENFEILMQGCVLAEPGGPWRLTFALGRVENLSFFIQIICWAP